MDLEHMIKPVPQRLMQGNGNISLGTLGKADFTVEVKFLSGSLSCLALDMLKSGLSKKINDCAAEAKGSVKITLEVSSDIPAEVKKNSDQAYSIKAEGECIELVGYGAAGLYYAVTTLLQCIKVENNEVTLPAFTLLDWPDLRTRGHFMECRYGSNLMKLSDWTALVDDMAEMKMNQLVVALYGCWCIQYDGIISEYVYIPVKKHPELHSDVIKKYYSPEKGEWINETVRTPMADEDFFGELIAYGKTRGVEVVPLWNSYGHNSLLPRTNPDISAKDKDGKPTGHGFCLSNPDTYETLFSIFDEIITRYLAPNGITSFHIGMDEVRDEIATDTSDPFKITSPWCECDECKKFTNEEKFLNHAIKLITFLKARGMKSVYIYSDMLTRIVNPATFKKLLEENDLLDVTVIDWWTYTNNKESLMFETMHPELGFRSTVKPWNSYYHWDMIFDAVPNTQILTELADKEQSAEGLQSYSAWDKSCDKNHVSMADYSWNFKGTGSVEEFNDRYAQREFGARYDEARRAIAIMDAVTKENIDFDRDGYFIESNTLGNVALLRSLTYYRYSYVVTGKPYPRNFPGEPVSLLLAKRGVYEKQLREIAELSAEALEIFDSISGDARCNTHLAKRFACEVNNYLCIAEDYLALLEIYDIVNAGDKSRAVCDKIAGIAKRRKNARLSLMLRIESVKEAFLIPSHLRNQSVFMQLFADIEAYAGTVNPEEFSLDVCDLRPIASDAFYKLR
ncbi:MAG: family 20 glycosylhydrolase [Oscillospiraceae bacterium]|nr:family 20 glycosylhydrolase [Oscillospiraceae bacterium]